MNRKYNKWELQPSGAINGTAVFLLMFFYTLMPISVYAEKDYLSSINERVERLQSRYRISFKYADFSERINYLKFSEVSAGEYLLLNDYLSLFEQEINKYPPGFFKDADVRGIGLVMALFAGEKPAHGLYNDKARIMLFDISRFSDNKALKRHSIHHEIFHMMIQRKKGYPLLSSEKWTSFNGSDFLYGKQTKPLRDSNPYNIHAPNQPGFVTYYAMESVLEDQAEVFACVMLKQHRRLIEKWMLKDSVLKEKIQAVKEFSKFYHSKMDKEYWEIEISSNVALTE